MRYVNVSASWGYAKIDSKLNQGIRATFKTGTRPLERTWRNRGGDVYWGEFPEYWGVTGRGKAPGEFPR
jgi:hypothetical protein